MNFQTTYQYRLNVTAFLVGMLSVLLVSCNEGSSSLQSSANVSSVSALAAYTTRVTKSVHPNQQQFTSHGTTIGCNSVQAMTVDSSGDVYAGTTPGVLENQFTPYGSGSMTWNPINGLPTSQAITAMITDESGDIYVARNDQYGLTASVWMYSVESSNWSQLGSSFANQINSILLESGAIYMGTSNGQVWGSYIINGRFMHWSNLTLYKPLGSRNIIQLFSPYSTLTYALAFPGEGPGGGVWAYSGNPSGGAWSQIINQQMVGNGTIYAAAVDESNNLYIAETSESAVWKCTRARLGPQCVNFGIVPDFGTTAITLDSNNNVYVASWQNNIWECPQPGNGATCTEIGNLRALTGTPEQITSTIQVYNDQANHNTIIYVLVNNNIWQYDSNLGTWSPIHSFSEVGVPDGSSVNTLTTTESSVYAGTDLGNVWQYTIGSNESFTQIPGQGTNGSLSGNPLTSLATESGNVYASSGFMSATWQLDENIASWDTVGYQLPQADYEIPVTLVADLNNNVYAGTPYGVFEYLAADESWTQLSGLGIDSSESSPVTSITYWANGNGLFAGSENGTVWYWNTNLWNSVGCPNSGNCSPISVLQFMQNPGGGSAITTGIQAGTMDGNVYVYNDSSWSDVALQTGTVTAISYVIPSGNPAFEVYANNGNYNDQTSGKQIFALAHNDIGGSFLTFGAGESMCQVYGSAAVYTCYESAIVGSQIYALASMTPDDIENINYESIVYVGTIAGTLWQYIHNGSYGKTSYLSTVPGSQMITTMTLDNINKNNLYVGTGDGNVASLESTGAWTTLSGIGTNFKLHGRITAPLTTDYQGNLYIGTLYGNIWELPVVSPESWTKLANIFRSDQTVDGSPITALGYSSLSNQILVGTKNGQLLYYAGVGFTNYPDYMNDGSAITAIAISPPSHALSVPIIAVGTESGNLYYQASIGRFIPHHFNQPINSLVLDSSGTLYVGTDHLWLSYWNSQVNQYESFIQIDTNDMNGRVNSLSIDSSGNVYAGTESGQVWTTNNLICPSQ